MGFQHRADILRDALVQNAHGLGGHQPDLASVPAPSPTDHRRIARDLHDTLLQSFHGLMPRLQAVVNLLPGRASDARQVLEAAVDDAAQAITEARNAVQDMRSSATTENDLAKAVRPITESRQTKLARKESITT